MEKQIEFDIKVEKNDMYDFLMSHFYSSFSGRFGIVLSIGALMVFFYGLGKAEMSKLILLLVLALLFTVVQPLQMKQKAAAQVKNNPLMQEPFHFVFDEKGMHVSQKKEKAFLAWKEVRQVKETKHSIFVYATSINANILPKEQLGENLEPLKALIKESVNKADCHLK